MTLFMNMHRLGTKYGGWHVPKRLLLSAPNIAVCVGAGEDLSYDLILSAFCNSVYIIDPTPKALSHWTNTLLSLSANQPFYSKPDMFNYQDYPYRLQNIHYLAVGVHDSTGSKDFYPPSNPEHASYSIDNIQNTNSPVKLPVIDPISLSRIIGTCKPDILKLDIEGAEVPFINKMLLTPVRPRLLQVEFDSLLIADNSVSITVANLISTGYNLIVRENRNFCFLLTE